MCQQWNRQAPPLSREATARNRVTEFPATGGRGRSRLATVVCDGGDIWCGFVCFFCLSGPGPGHSCASVCGFRGARAEAQSTGTFSRGRGGDELHQELHLALGRSRQKPSLIRSFFEGAERGLRSTCSQRPAGIDAVVDLALEANLDGRRNRNRPEDDARRHTANPRRARRALRSTFPFEFNGIRGIT
jgi:hypothetical protein